MGTEAIDIADYSIEYFIFEENLKAEDLRWSYFWSEIGNSFNITFSDLDAVVESGDKKTNINCSIIFQTNYLLEPGSSFRLQYHIYKHGWNYNFDKSDDWSYTSNTNYSKNDNLVVINIAKNELISGNSPIDLGIAKPYGVDLNWMGEHLFSDFEKAILKKVTPFVKQTPKFVMSILTMNGKS